MARVLRKPEGRPRRCAEGRERPLMEAAEHRACQRRADFRADRRLVRGREDHRRQAQGQGAGQGCRAFASRRAAGDAGFDPRADADPRLSDPRPFPRQARPARPRAGKERGGARSALLWLHRSRLRPQDFPRQGARPRIRDHARDHRHPPAHLLPDARRRVHAHLRSGAEGLDAGAHRRTRQGDHLHPRGQARDPQQAGRGRKASRSSAT